MMKGGTREGQVGPHKKSVMGEGYHNVKVARAIQWVKSQIMGTKGV
jgi:aromatic ring-cleaving dioxygenase